MKRLLSPSQFAKEIGMSEGFVRELIKAGEIEVTDVRAPGATLPRYRIDPAEAAKWLASRQTRLAPGPKLVTPQRRAAGRRFVGSVPEVIH